MRSKEYFHSLQNEIYIRYQLLVNQTKPHQVSIKPMLPISHFYMSSTVGTESFCPNYEQPDHMCSGPDINPAGHTLCESYTHRARPFHISNYPAAVLGNTCQTEVMAQSCVCWKQLIVWTEFTKNLRTIIVVVFLYTCRNLNCDFGIKTYSYAQEW